jgi:hypothetical protein
MQAFLYFGLEKILSGIFHSLDFCSTFDQAKVERKITKISGLRHYMLRIEMLSRPCLQ